MPEVPPQDEQAPASPAVDPANEQARLDARQRRIIGWGATAAIASAVLAVTANLSEVASLLAPDETRELVEETRGVIQGTDEKVEELLAMLRVQAVASGLDLNIESEATIESAIRAIVQSGNAQKKTALAHLDDGDIETAAARLAGVAAEQATAVTATQEAAAESWREAAALQRSFDIAAAVQSYAEALRLQPGHPATLDMHAHTLILAGQLDAAEQGFGQLLVLEPEAALAASAHLGLGTIAKQRGQYDNADASYRKSLEIAESNPLLAERVYARRALGQLKVARGDIDAAVEDLRIAMSLAEELGDKRLLAQVLNARGILAARQEKFDDAEELLQRAVAIHESRNDKSGRALSLANLGAVALSRGDLTTAESTLTETVMLGEQLGWQSSVAYDLVNLAAISAANSRFGEADERLARAQDIAEKIGLAELEPVIVFNRGEVSRDAGDMVSACQHWQEALVMMQSMGSEHVQTALTQIENAGCAEQL